MSRRTDIPAFFTPWWLERVRAGHVLVRNPRNASQVLHVSLRPDDVHAVVYWSRDYGNLLPHLAELDERGLKPCFHLTLTGCGPPLEAQGPPVPTIINQLEQLARRYSPRRLVWRYDPIVLGTKHDERHHDALFAALAREIAPLVDECIVSFLDPYPSTRRELAKISDSTGEVFGAPRLVQRRALVMRLRDTAARLDLPLRACCEAELEDLLPRARCIDPDRIRDFAGEALGVFRVAPTRKGCGCVHARDVGAYHTCARGCAYCYANESPERGQRGADAVQSHANHLGPGQLQPSRVAAQSRQLTPVTDDLADRLGLGSPRR
ncbi:MAG: DUF1848 domain-containing protein [Polyangiaceae bacterium]|nr:DUF1848 domain-containing protein [Polyangiaceae bacterium]